MQLNRSHFLALLAFVAAYVALDRLSYIEPLYGLNITPWNPPPALGLVFWLVYGRVTAAFWFIALVISEFVTRQAPEGLLLTIALSAWLTFGYSLIGTALTRYMPSIDIFDNRRRLLIWINTIVVGTLLNSVGYVAMVSIAALIPAGGWPRALASFWIGDCVGIVTSMPFFWILATEKGRSQVWRVLAQGETVGYVLLAVAVLVFVFANLSSSKFNHFYFLFLPVIWAAARQGLAGAVVATFAVQHGVIAAVEWRGNVGDSVFEYQLLTAVLGLVGFFIGVVVDEQREASQELKRSLRLTAAGDMASALAHELNQPITALAAYGKSCEHLLARGETGEVLRQVIHRMISESTRAAEVVRRLRDFFRTGALRLEAVDLNYLIAEATTPLLENFAERSVELQTHVQSGVTLFLDRLQIELVLRNLLVNACDAVSSLAQGPRRVTLSARLLGGGRVQFSIDDSGPGVSPNIAERLFEPFVSSKSSGLGLGLAISKTIVEAHGGTLWAETTDHGVFRFELPMLEKMDHAAI